MQSPAPGRRAGAGPRAGALAHPPSAWPAPRTASSAPPPKGLIAGAPSGAYTPLPRGLERMRSSSCWTVQALSVPWCAESTWACQQRTDGRGLARTGPGVQRPLC